jgi:hypothetical protein
MAIFFKGFEEGDFSAWTGVSGTPSVSNVVSHHGTWSATVSADTNEYWYQDGFSSGTNRFCRFYWRIETLPSWGDWGDIVQLVDTADSVRLRMGYWNDADTIKWFLSVTGQTEFTESVSVGTWYNLEVEYDADDDLHHLYRNGTEIIEVSNAETTSIDQVRMGSPFAGGQLGQTMYFDCVEVDSSYIGPEATVSIPVMMHHYGHHINKIIRG